MTLSVDFTVESEQHALEAFQKGGHFVPGMKDENGFRREWQGDEVHILKLNVWGTSPLAGQQILRVLADTPQEAARLMRQTIQETMLAHWVAQQLCRTNYEDWVALNEKRNQFQQFINAHYPHEIQTGQHTNLPTVFDVAVRYLHKERNSLRNRITRWLRHEKPAVASEWVPKEWRQ
jgi:hypothetical protein